MGFHEELLDPTISLGSTFGPGFKHSVIEMVNGQQEATSYMTQARHRFDFVKQVMKTKTQGPLKSFYLAVAHGLSNGFLVKDWSDYMTTQHGSEIGEGAVAVSATDQTFGFGDGSTKVFQLYKRYISGAYSYVHTIRKPVSGTVLISHNNVTQSSGFTIDYTTGEVTYSTAPALGVVLKWGGHFYVPCKFDKEIDDLLEMSIDEWDANSASIPASEIVNPLPVDEDYDYGFSSTLQFGANINLQKGHGRFLRLDPTAGSLRAYLPLKANVKGGGAHFYLENVGSNAVAIYDRDLDSSIVSLSAGGNKTVLLGLNSAGAKAWALF